jgi:hypothetical protein
MVVRNASPSRPLSTDGVQLVESTNDPVTYLAVVAVLGCSVRSPAMFPHDGNSRRSTTTFRYERGPAGARRRREEIRDPLQSLTLTSMHA